MLTLLALACGPPTEPEDTAATPTPQPREASCGPPALDDDLENEDWHPNLDGPEHERADLLLTGLVATESDTDGHVIQVNRNRAVGVVLRPVDHDPADAVGVGFRARAYTTDGLDYGLSTILSRGNDSGEQGAFLHNTGDDGPALLFVEVLPPGDAYCVQYDFEIAASVFDGPEDCEDDWDNDLDGTVDWWDPDCGSVDECLDSGVANHSWDDAVQLELRPEPYIFEDSCGRVGKDYYDVPTGVDQLSIVYGPTRYAMFEAAGVQVGRVEAGEFQMFPSAEHADLCADYTLEVRTMDRYCGNPCDSDGSNDTLATASPLPSIATIGTDSPSDFWTVDITPAATTLVTVVFEEADLQATGMELRVLDPSGVSVGVPIELEPANFPNRTMLAVEVPSGALVGPAVVELTAASSPYRTRYAVFLRSI